MPVSLQCVAICTVGELFGGIERHVLGLIDGLKTQGVRTLLVLFHDGELAIQARRQGVEPIILPHRNPLFFSTARQFARILKQQQIDIVHVHGYKATVYSALARRWHRFTMVKTEHGLPEPITGNSIRQWRNRLYHVLDTAATRAASSTVCYVTEDLQTYYRQAHARVSTRIVPNGVETLTKQNFTRPAELREDWFNLLVVGRLDIVKGHHIAIEAIAHEDLASNIHLHLVGVGPREQELRALADSLGVAHRVHLLGFRRNVYDYIAYSDVLLIPSLHEGLPYTLLEAMALGTPIIASHVGGLAEVLQDGVTALLTPPQDVVHLALAIARLYRDHEFCVQLGVAGRSLQQAKYSLKAMTETYLTIYQTVLGKGE